MSWRHWLLKFSNGIWLVAVLLVVVLATYVALGRYLMPFVASYKEDVELRLEQLLGHPLEIGGIRGGWDGFDPVLFVREVQLVAEADVEPAFSMRDFRLRLNVWQSLRQRKFIFQDIYITGVNLRLQQSAGGGWHLVGLSPQPSQGSGWQEVRQYLAQPNVDIAEVKVTLVNQDGESSLWRLPRVHMQDLGKGYEASGSLLQPGSNERFLQFSLRGQGNPLGGDFSGLIYVDWLSGPFLDPFLQAYSLKDVRLSHIDASGTGWLTFEQGRLQDVQGNVRLNAVQWRTDTLAIAPVENLSFKFHLALEQHNWQLLVDQLDFYWQGERWKPSSLAVRAGQGRQLIAQVSRIPLGLASQLAQATQLLPIVGVDELAGREPTGELRNLWLRVPLGESAHELFELRADLSGVNVTGFHSAPGATGIDGYLRLTEKQGLVEFKSRNLGLNFPELFDQGWTFRRGEGVVSWQTEAGRTEVVGRNIRLSLPDRRGDIEGGFLLRTGDEELPDEDRFDLSLKIRDMDASLARSFIPCLIVSAGICDWVATSVKEGSVPRGSYDYSHFINPDSGLKESISRLHLELEQGVVALAPEWPAAEDVAATVALDGGVLEVAIQHARLADTLVRDARVWIPPAPTGDPVLQARVQTNLSAHQVSGWLQQPVLKEAAGAIVDDWSLAGEFQTNVDLKIPLSQEPAHVRVVTTTADGALTIPAVDLTLGELQGTFVFDSDEGFSAKQVQADLLGRPAQLTLRSPSWRPDHKVIQVEATGKLSLPDVYAWRALEALPGVQGEPAYKASLLAEISDAKPNLTLDVQTDLVGVAVDWPEPLRKDAAEKLNLRYVHRFPLDSAVSEAQLALGNLANGKFRFGEEGYQGGVLAFNDKKLPTQFSGTLIKGNLKRVDADAWRTMLEDQLQLPTQPETQGPALRVDLEVDRLHLLGRELQQVHFQLGRENAGWRLALDSPEQVAGYLLLPDNDKSPVQGRFDYLKLASGDGQELGKVVSPRSLPLLDIDVKKLMLGEQDFGTWSFITERRDQGTIFKDVVGRVGGALVEGRMSWFEDGDTGQQTTILTGTLKGKEVEKILAHLGETSSVTSKRVELEVGLVWPAAPMDFEIARASGSVALKMEDGIFRETGRSAEAVRVFGVLNMESITRRLRLDFSDLYKKGLSYDLMEGKASLSYGVMKLEQPLAIKAPSSAYKITGEADLNAETLNMEMVTILPVTQNLPLAALLVGAPQVGGALFLIDRLLGDPLSRLTSVTYTIKGNFQDPKLELKGMFDSRSQSNSNDKRKNATSSKQESKQ